MTALDGLLARLRAAGLTIRADGGDLVLGGCTDALTPELRRQLSAHKPALLAHLAPPLPDGALPLWLYDLVWGTPASEHTPPPPDLDPEQIAAAVQAAKGDAEALARAARRRFPADDDAPDDGAVMIDRPCRWCGGRSWWWLPPERGGERRCRRCHPQPGGAQ